MICLVKVITTVVEHSLLRYFQIGVHIHSRSNGSPTQTHAYAHHKATCNVLEHKPVFSRERTNSVY